ncbi:formylmethanofuran dehydrogenase subunit E [Candidatus Magnetoovum chiemensis]|nr:formylmethanofuran dehydrogenase subunit E [Candidatus Magnetoovum chiemensis]
MNRELTKVIDFHGHYCPGLAMGYRIAALALSKFFTARSQDEEIVSIAENKSCSIDAVQVMTGCTLGKGNLIINDYGKQVYTFIKRDTGQAIRIAVKWQPYSQSAEDEKTWKLYKKGDRSQEVVNSINRIKSQKITAITDAPDDDLFDVTWFKTIAPEKARIYPSVKCANCSEKLMEPSARIHNGKIVCIPCAERLTKEDY